MRITQGPFSYLPDLSDAEIEAQVRYALRNGWAVVVEHTDDPHPRNLLWALWSQPHFDLGEEDAHVVLDDVRACRAEHPNHYAKLVCYDRTLGRQTTALAFIVHRPAEERGFRVSRKHGADRRIGYGLERA